MTYTVSSGALNSTPTPTLPFSYQCSSSSSSILLMRWRHCFFRLSIHLCVHSCMHTCLCVCKCTLTGQIHSRPVCCRLLVYSLICCCVGHVTAVNWPSVMLLWTSAVFTVLTTIAMITTKGSSVHLCGCQCQINIILMIIIIIIRWHFHGVHMSSTCPHCAVFFLMHWVGHWTSSLELADSAPVVLMSHRATVHQAAQKLLLPFSHLVLDALSN